MFHELYILQKFVATRFSARGSNFSALLASVDVDARREELGVTNFVVLECTDSFLSDDSSYAGSLKLVCVSRSTENILIRRRCLGQPRRRENPSKTPFVSEMAGVVELLHSLATTRVRVLPESDRHCTEWQVPLP